MVVGAAIHLHSLETGEWHIVGGDEFVVEIHLDAADDVTGFLEEQVVGQRLGAGAVVFDRQNAVLAETEIDGVNDLHIVVELDAARIIEKRLSDGQIVRVAADGDAARCWKCVVGEGGFDAVDEAFIWIDELALATTGDAEKRFVGFAQRHDEIRAFVLGDMVEDPKLAVAIKDRQIVGFLIFRHVLGQVEAFDDEGLQLLIDSVDLNADII